MAQVGFANSKLQKYKDQRPFLVKLPSTNTDPCSM